MCVAVTEDRDRYSWRRKYLNRTLATGGTPWVLSPYWYDGIVYGASVGD